MNSCKGCGRPATQMWQRYATETELRAAATDPKIPSVSPADTLARKPVFACDDCAFPPVVDDQGVERPSDLSAIVHDADCPAPAHSKLPCCSATGESS